MKVIQNFLQEAANVADDITKLINSEKENIKKLQNKLKELNDKFSLKKAIPAKKSLTAAIDDLVIQIKKSIDNLKDIEDKGKKRKKRKKK